MVSLDEEEHQLASSTQGVDGVGGRGGSEREGWWPGSAKPPLGRGPTPRLEEGIPLLEAGGAIASGSPTIREHRKDLTHLLV
jgi:hypothetical protein